MQRDEKKMNMKYAVGKDGWQINSVDKLPTTIESNAKNKLCLERTYAKHRQKIWKRWKKRAMQGDREREKKMSTWPILASKIGKIDSNLFKQNEDLYGQCFSYQSSSSFSPSIFLLLHIKCQLVNANVNVISPKRTQKKTCKNCCWHRF